MPESYTYRYPSAASYALLPVSRQHDNFRWQGRSLRHGYIFGYKETGAFAPAGGWDVFQNLTAVNRQINYENSKIFQFNPAALSMAVSMMNVESSEVQASGGALANPAVGLATTRLELFFDRTEEIARSNNGIGNEIWRDLGVQVDLFDFLKVISGGDSSLLGQYTDTAEEGGTVRAGSLNHLTGQMFDAAVAGSKLMFRPFAVVFNPNLSIHVQRMISFSFTFLRFTSDLVPTTVKVEMDLEVTNMGSKSYVTSSGASGPVGQQPTAAAAAPPGVATTDSTLRPMTGVY